MVKYLGNVLDETKDLVDDMLDRARDVEHDMRDTVRRAVEIEDDEDTDTRDDELAELRTAVLRLTQKVEELSALQRAGRERDDADNREEGAKS